MSPSPRQAAVFVTALFVLPTLALLLPTAAASGTGTTILTDPTGDNTGGQDILRLGGFNDASQIHFYVQVANPNALGDSTGVDYYITFHTGPTGTGSKVTGCDFFAHIQVLSPHTVATADVDTQVNTPAGGVGTPDATACFTDPTNSAFGFASETAEWVGNELVFDLNRADIFGAKTTDVAMTSISVEDQSDGTTGTLYDDSAVAASYSMANTPASITVPSAPLGLAASASTNSATLSWSAPASNGGAAITGYNVYRGDAAGAEAASPIGSTATRSFVDSGLVSGHSYYYVVAAVNSQGVGARSAEVVATPAAPQVPDAPTGLVAKGSDHAVSLSWNAPVSDGNSPITSYNVYRGTPTTSLALLSSSATTSFTDGAVTNGNTYVYDITAVNAIGESAHSAAATATPRLAMGFVVSRAPAGLHAGLLGDESDQQMEPSVGWYNATKEAAFMSFTATFWAHKDATGNVLWRDGSSSASQINADPILFTDRVTGRTWAGGLENDQVVGLAGFCSALSTSDDGGKTWVPVSVPCDASIDHETIGSGPYHAGANKPPVSASPTLNRVVYYCSQLGISSGAAATPSIACTTSVDGGMTFGEENVVQGSCGFLHGHVKVGGDGTAVVPDSHCGAKQGIFRTTDNGVSWSSVQLPIAARGTQDGFDPSVAWGNDGKLFFVGGTPGDNQPLVSVSGDDGSTWSAPVNVAAASGLHLAATTFHVAVAGDAGRAAVAYLGTPVGTGNPFKAGFHGVWYLYVSYTYDGGATWQTTQVTPDPVQRGHIWDAGGSDTQRNLLDFMDATLDEQGRVVVGYSDGCVDACAASTGTEADSIGHWAHFAWQTDGRPLFTAFDTTLAAPSAPQAFSAVGSDGQVALSWAAPASTGGTPVTGYKIAKGLASDAITTLVTQPGTTFVDTAVTDGTTYYYAVSAINAIGEGPRTDVASALPHAIAPPTAPTAFLVQASDGSVTLTWLPPTSDGNSPITGYTVFRGDAPDAESQLATLAPGLSYVDHSVTNGQTYYYKVAAKNAAGLGASTGEQSAKPLPKFAPMGFDITQPQPDLALKSVVGGTLFTLDTSAGEPTIGWYNGTSVVNVQSLALPSAEKGVLFQAFADTLKAVRDPVTGHYAWSAVTAPDQQINIDPMLFTDHVTGRTFSGGMEGNLAGVGVAAAMCSYFDISDDGGKTWTPADIPCASGQDHETIASGAFHAPLPNGVIPGQRAVYLCNQLSIQVSGKIPIGCVASWDGGRTYSQESTVLGSCIYLHGHIRIDEGDGTAYVPDNNCGTHQGVFLTEDNGVTWNSFEIPGTKNRGTTGNGFDPAVAITPDHTVYFFGENAGATGNHAPIFSKSTDHARTWTPPVDIAAASGVHFYATTFQKAVAGDDGRVAVAYMGTQTGHGSPFNNCGDCVWDLYVSITYDGGATWETHKATSDPVQRGWIYSVGTGDQSGSGQRNLLDFMDANLDDHGHVLVGYADGCIAECALPTGTPTMSHKAMPSIAWQTSGRGLFAAFDVPATVPGIPTLKVLPLDGGAKLTWDTPTDGGLDITGYTVTRDGVAIATVSGNSVADSGLTNGVTYTYAVSAANVLGHGAYSQAKTVVPRVDTVPPGALTGVQVTSAKDHAVSLAWNPGNDDIGVDHYAITRDGVALATTSGLSYTDGGLKDGRYYAYGVSAVDGAGNVGPATTLRVRPVTVPSTYFLGKDTTNDVLNGGKADGDIVSAGILTDASSVHFEITVKDMGTHTTTEAYDATFTVNGIKFDAEYDVGGTRCNAYHDVKAGAVVGGAGTCSVSGNVVRLAFNNDPSGGGVIFSPGDTFSAISFSTADLSAATQTGGAKANDVFPNGGATFDFVAGTPARAEPPTFTDATGALTGAEASPIGFNVSATHPTDDVTYSASGLPSGATFDAATGAFTWTPSYAQAGAYDITVVADTGAANATKHVTLAIANVDRPLVLDAIGDKVATELQTLTFAAHATDADGGTIHYAVTGAPNGLRVNSVTGVVTWTPTVTQGGNLATGFKSYTMTIVATDGPSSDSETITIKVLNADRSPVLAGFADQTGPEGSTLKTLVTFADPDLDPVMLSASAPATLRIVQAGIAEISYTPQEGDAGDYPIVISATDTEKTVTATAMFHVTHHADFAFGAISPTQFQKSPGEHVTLSATITNMHPQQDLFQFVVAQTASWSVAPHSPVPVASGDTVTVTLDVTVPDGATFDDIAVTASSMLDTTQHQTANYHVIVPVVPTLHVGAKFVSIATGSPTGTVVVRHLDGTLVKGIQVLVRQTPQNAPALTSTSASTTSDDGTAAYSFARDPSAKVPGIHDLVVTVRVPGAPDAVVTNAYFVG